MGIEFRLLPRPWGTECVFDNGEISGSFLVDEKDDVKDMINAEISRISASNAINPVDVKEDGEIVTFDEAKKELSEKIDSFKRDFPTKEATDYLSSMVSVVAIDTKSQVNDTIKEKI